MEARTQPHISTANRADRHPYTRKEKHMSENYIMMSSEEEIRQAFEKMKADIMMAVSEMFNCAISRIANRDGNVIQYPTKGESPSAFLENICL